MNHKISSDLPVLTLYSVELPHRFGAGVSTIDCRAESVTEAKQKLQKAVRKVCRGWGIGEPVFKNLRFTDHQQSIDAAARIEALLAKHAAA